MNSVCMKATRIIGRIFRKYYYHVSYSSLLQLYTSLVLPHLEYASAILWSPFLLGDKTRIAKACFANVYQVLGRTL